MRAAAEPLVAEAAHLGDDRQQRRALVGQLVLDPRGRLGIAPANDDLLQRKSGEWSNRTPAQVKIDFAVTRADVGLALVDNTADVDKPVSIAEAALVSQAINDHRGDPGAHPQYVPYSVYIAGIANQILAERAQSVVMMVSGVPLRLR